MPRMYNPAHTEIARKLRRNMTPKEKILWYKYLRIAPVRYRRQVPIDNYVVDFYCPKLHLAIELDGSQHYTNKGITKDLVRTKALSQYGITVLRIPNNMVRNNLDGICTYLNELTEQIVNSEQ